ncbi:protein tyrosine phosphatase non-receptor type 14 [Rhinolophus ferrumequinum]|uniref:Tyrosine-protein phosphatase non-receptor type n=1 Tax=Rhinolophus ferrumequinum TaxID=59479 RepID=A0A7J7SYQ9_RHIFE|nr:protein tyrosine phosphatase non-receptor type 14 [Rhinolophus ferrumequinum]
MPFGLKLRRTRRYNVLSKNCFVTRIRLLDSSVIECTLSVESTGQECLEAVAQRLELRETHYFGLWFLSKSQQARWVELEKPLKKHLDKFANEPLLFFGVMFYVPNVSWLQQEATRYQYYLQVKKDVLEGRLRCTLEQVVRLAGLAVQADFGDYNHFDSQDFLREYVLFPMDLALEEAVLEELTQKVAQEHKAHSGILPAEAELMYINEVERLDGFGQEIFPVKDNHGNSVHLGIFFMGIFVRNRIGRQAVIHRWNDIGNITHTKSTILVELVNKEETALFHTDDIENAKYISRLFATRHKFYKQNKICTEQSNSPPPIRRQPTWSRSSLPRQQPYILPPMHVQCGEHYSETHTSQDSIFHGNEDAFYCNSHNSLDLNYLNGTITNGSVCSVHSINSLNCSQSFIQASPVSSNLSIPGSDIMRADYIPSHRHSAIIVPSYRPTPDYETVMRQMKRGVMHTDSQSQSLRNLNIINTHAYNHPEELVYSQPEMRERHPYTVPYGPQGGYSNKLNLEKQKMAGLEAQKRPLMLAALNGLSVARVSGREESRVDGTRVPMDERFRTLKKKLEEGMVFTEYEQIPKKKANGIFSTAALPENAERSRIREVVPYEENRVELIPTKENNTGYINASHIKVVVGGAEWHYIATQGPLPHTCHDFWQMVWEQGANVIAMVTAEEEGGRTKSHRYWPKLGSKHSSATYGKFKVTTKFRTDSGCYATTGLKVKHLLSGQERTVWHLQYTDWPDHGCPEDVQGFLSYLEEIQSVRRHTNSMLEGTKNQHPPIVVHCSAGVGRTGVVILSELMIYCLEHNEKVEVPMMLRLLREQRMFMIQTIAQYKFVYQVLIQFLQNSRLI